MGTPGGDCQDQWTLQLFLGMADGGLGLQEACDAPLLHSAHFPNSFWPREARPGVVLVEPELASGLVRGVAHTP